MRDRFQISLASLRFKAMIKTHKCTLRLSQIVTNQT
ncbi:hypothetical protein LOK49_LG08G01505 [Camellia lanceoleosa]|uniref:Uncharacterized protein n=1 Tax=Camellia lanceoleosa TaxID=1840588 RepID=A0ACC0GXG7_9ERIC|nr:hypothetical protein LOK49_LG08G01505 [Camellia lanceoleosa]